MRRIFITITWSAAVSGWLLSGCAPTNTEHQTSGDSVITAVANPEVKIPSAEDSAVWEAETRLRKDSSEENFIWYGRRLGYAERMEDAVAAFTSGLSRYPDSYKLYRFRGHRYISLKDFSLAVIDLERAARLAKGKKIELEPDGIPNKLNKPLSTYQFNIYYHLGLAYYMIGDFYRAQTAYQECMKYSVNDDLLVATADWLYMTLRRMNDVKAAEQVLRSVPERLDIIENDSYAIRIRLYKGQVKPEEVLQADSTGRDYHLNLATQGYGVANWYYYTGEPDKARHLMEEILKGKSTYSFGYIAAQTDLQRLWR